MNEPVLDSNSFTFQSLYLFEFMHIAKYMHTFSNTTWKEHNYAREIVELTLQYGICNLHYFMAYGS